MDEFRRIHVCYKIKDRIPCKDVVFMSILRFEEFIKTDDYYSIEVFDINDNLLFKDIRVIEVVEETKSNRFFNRLKRLFTK